MRLSLLRIALVLGITVAARCALSETVTVTDCVRLALARSPEARAAGFDVSAASERVRAARRAYAPRLSAQTEYGHAEGFDEAITNRGSTAALLTFEATLLDGGLRDAQFAAARARLRSAAALEQQRRADVALAVRSAYFAALSARTEATIQQATIRTLRDYVTLLQQQERLGLVTQTDVLRAQLAVETARAARRTARAQRDTALSELAVLIGADLAEPSLTEPEAVQFSQPTDGMIDASPVIRDAQAAAEAAQREADAVRSEWRGHLAVTASAGALGVDPGVTFRDHGGGQFLFGFSVPLFDGGATAARIATAVASAHAAEATAQQARQTIHIALARTGVEAQRAERELRAWQRTVPRAAESFQLMRARYFGGGNVRLLEVLDALSQYVDAQNNVPRALLAYRLAVASAAHILGQANPEGDGVP